MAGMDGDFRHFSTTGMTPSLGPGDGRLKAGVILMGAATSLALVMALSMWGYRLAVRDVSGIPVVRAIEGPARVAPVQPGGDIADHQGLAVNEVAAVGTAAPTAEVLVLAPRPVDLALDDMAGLGPLTVPDTSDVVAQSLQTALAPDALTEAIGGEGIGDGAIGGEAIGGATTQTEDAIAMALAEALADDEGAALTGENLPEGVVARSLRPVARPGSGVSAVEDVAAPQSAPIIEIDAASLEPGTRLIQFGAYDSTDVARAEWVVLQGRYGALMDGKSMVLQEAASGGRQFFRLRAHGFADEAEARRFCSAILTENGACLPVVHR